MLSNTATPRYYGEFRDAVLRGEIRVCREISMQMHLIDDLIANPKYYYDDNAINGFIKFCEKEMTLRDGSDAFLTPAFKLWAEDLLSWFYFEERSVYVPNKNSSGGHYENKLIKYRLRNKQFITLGRGGAKSMYDSYVQSYFLTVDTSTTQQIVVAPREKQALEIMEPIKTAITRSRGPLFKFMTYGSLQNTTGSKMNRTKLASTKDGIKNFLTNSVIMIRPMSIDALQGLNSKVNTLDEWLSGDIREDVITPLEQGAAKIKDWLLICTSSEGTVRGASGDTIKMELMARLKGEYYDPHTSIWWYKLDDIKEVGDESMWIKANPNLGITVSYETYEREVEKAQYNPEAYNDTMAKRFGLPMEGFTYFFAYDECKPWERKLEFWGMQCALGMDASLGDDFYAFTFLFPLRDDSFGAKTRCYITELTLNKLPLAARVRYEDFIKEGSLIVMPGTVLEYDAIYEDVYKYVSDNQYDVRCFGYDPWNAKEFVNQWEVEMGPSGMEKVRQGSRTESVPLGEIKKMASERMILFDQKLIGWTMENSIVLLDNNGNRKLHKKRADDKIDAVAALLDAYVAYKAHKNFF